MSKAEEQIEEHKSSWSVWEVVAWVLPFLAGLWGAGMGPEWLDAAEFVASSVVMGVPHPPGHPSYMGLGGLCLALPLGSLAFRLSLFSALCLGVAGGMAYRGALRLLGGLAAWPRQHSLTRALALFASLLPALSYSCWFQAVRPEVYALNAALSLLLIEGTLAAIEEREDPRSRLCAWLRVGLGVGLGLANHHFLIVLLLPGVGLGAGLAGLYQRGQGRERMLLVLLVGLGLLSYLYLPLRSQQNPPINWGAAHSWKGWFWTVSGKAWQRSLQPQDTAQPLSLRALRLARLLTRQWGIVATLLALVGLYFLLRLFWRKGGVLLLFFAGGGLSRLLMRVDATNPDLHGYLTPTFFLLGWGVAFALALFIDRLPRQRWQPAGRPLVAVIMAALSLSSLLYAAPRCQLSRHHAPLLWMEILERDLPQGSVVLSSQYQNGFLRWYRRHVERARPDLLWLPRNLMSYPFFLQTTGKRHPTLRPLIRYYQRRDPRLTTELARLAQRKPLCLEWFEDLSPRLFSFLEPRGLWLCWKQALRPSFPASPPSSTPASRSTSSSASRPASAPLPDSTPSPTGGMLARRRRFWQKTYALLRPYLRDGQTRALLLWSHFVLARYWRHHHRWRLALLEVRYGLRLAPYVPELKKMRRLFLQRLQQ
jgi:hypothetical protein